MNDVHRVCEGDGIADLLHHAELRGQIAHHAGIDQLLQIAAVEQLHGYEETSRLFAEVVNDDDVRMSQPRR